MIQFPKNIYADIRIEMVKKTTIHFENLVLKQNKTRIERGAMLRVYDGNRWYYSAITDLDAIQTELNALAAMAKPNSEILMDPLVQQYEVHTGEHLRYSANCIADIPNTEKVKLLESYLPILQSTPSIKKSDLIYMDNYTIKHIFSSKGTDIRFDTQNGCVVAKFTLMPDKENGIPQSGQATIYKTDFNTLKNHQDMIRTEIEKEKEFAENAVPVEPGEYTCVLSPTVAGVFAHESFGHKSEADFMVGDEEMAREWAIGSHVGASILDIIDSGIPEGSGYVPFDDEGSRASETYLIRDGILSGRLHSAMTATILNEKLTGNARAINFQFEPIVRMTTTYIGAGELSKEELFAGIKNGLFIDTFKHGSGMTTFTIAPSRAYRIENGKITTPVRISVIMGNVMKTLHEIDGLSNEVEIISFGTGGCGKMEQYPLRVGFGGPYVRVNHIQVQ